MNTFFDATPLLRDTSALRARMKQDGYLYLKGIIAPEILLSLRSEITTICERHGWMKSGTDHTLRICDHNPVVEGDEDYFPIYDEIQRVEALHSLSHEAAIINTMRAVVGDSVFPHPLSICRLVFPDNNAWATPPHQDYPNNQGTEDLFACWIPLSDCPREMGSLSVLKGSNQLGLLPLKYALGAGHRQSVMDDRHESLEWVSGDFDLGDVLLFHSLTVHKSLANDTDKMRISVDYRFQREGEAMTRACLNPHFNRESWAQIYRGWKRPELQYYWRDKQVIFEEWDSSLHELPKEHFKDALKLMRQYDEQRKS